MREKMKNCGKFENLFSDYFEKTLSKELEQKVFNHLEKCKNCQKTYNNFKKIINLMPKLSYETPVFLEKRLKMIPIPLPQEPIKSENNLCKLKWIAATFVSFAVLFNLFYFTNLNPRMNKFLHNMIFQIQKIKVKTESIYGKLKRKKLYENQSNYLIALNVIQEKIDSQKEIINE